MAFTFGQCSRLKPSYEFHFEGLSNFSTSIEELVQVQDVNPRIKKWNTRLILNLCMNYMVHVSSTIWRIKHQPFNSPACSDSALRLLALAAGIFIMRTSSDVFIFNLGLRSEGLFWERYILKCQITFKGHWRLQSWILRLALFPHDSRKRVEMLLHKAK